MRAFLQCAKEEGIDKLAEYLLCNQGKGLNYHYDYTYQGDYDGYQRVEEVLQVLRTGKADISPYDRYLRYQTEHFILRLVKQSDAENLLVYYSNTESYRFFNSDNCDYGFHYDSLQDMRLCIGRWIDEYRNKAFIRFAIIDRKAGKAIGTVEIFARAELDEQYNKVGVLRIDLLPVYEQKQYISEILGIANNNFYDAFRIDHIITKAISEAIERRMALAASGFSPLESNKIMPYSDYFIR
jgi:RimJ/RimL family protein N-acetyltransferase